MRNIFLLSFVLALIPVAFIKPHVGILLWSWISYMNPHRISWGLIYDFQFALLIGGVVITESVYNIPGLGRLVVDAILKRDYPIIQGLILMFSFVYILVNLAIDIIYTMIDPRIRY